MEFWGRLEASILWLHARSFFFIHYEFTIFTTPTSYQSLTQTSERRKDNPRDLLLFILQTLPLSLLLPPPYLILPPVLTPTFLLSLLLSLSLPILLLSLPLFLLLPRLFPYHYPCPSLISVPTPTRNSVLTSTCTFVSSINPICPYPYSCPYTSVPTPTSVLPLPFLLPSFTPSLPHPLTLSLPQPLTPSLPLPLSLSLPRPFACPYCSPYFHSYHYPSSYSYLYSVPTSTLTFLPLHTPYSC